MRTRAMTRITITAPDALADAVALLASVYGCTVPAMWLRLATEAHSVTGHLTRLATDCTRTTATRERAGVLLGLLLDART